MQRSPSPSPLTPGTTFTVASTNEPALEPSLFSPRPHHTRDIAQLNFYVWFVDRGALPPTDVDRPVLAAGAQTNVLDYGKTIEVLQRCARRLHDTPDAHVNSAAYQITPHQHK